MEVELCVGNAKVLVKTNYKPADGKYLFERLLDVAIAHMNIYKHKIPSEPVGKIVHISQVQNDNKGPLT